MTCVCCISLEPDSAKSPAVEATSHSPFCIHCTMFVKEFKKFSNFAPQPGSLIRCWSCLFRTALPWIRWHPCLQPLLLLSCTKLPKVWFAWFAFSFERLRRRLQMVGLDRLHKLLQKLWRQDLHTKKGPNLSNPSSNLKGPPFRQIGSRRWQEKPPEGPELSTERHGMALKVGGAIARFS